MFGAFVGEWRRHIFFSAADFAAGTTPRAVAQRTSMAMASWISRRNGGSNNLSLFTGQRRTVVLARQRTLLSGRSFSLAVGDFMQRPES